MGWLRYSVTQKCKGTTQCSDVLGDDGGRPGGDCEPQLKARASWGEAVRMWRGDRVPEGSPLKWLRGELQA